MSAEEMNFAEAEAMGMVAAEVRRERYAQHRKWGEQNHDDGTWLAILTEETGEAATAILRQAFDGQRPGATLREELIQVAAVAVAWVEAIDRREAAA